MNRTVWFAAGAVAGIYAVVKGRQAAEALTPDGLRDRAQALGLGMRLLRDEVAQGRVEKEAELRERVSRLAALAPQPTEGVAALAPQPTEGVAALAPQPTEGVAALAPQPTEGVAALAGSTHDSDPATTYNQIEEGKQ